MAPAWERARRALATRLCLRFPARHVAIEDAPRELDYVEVLVPVPAVEAEEEEREKSPATVSPAPASARRLSRSGSLNSAICAICLGGMRIGHGQALFTAECSHRFHFHCISSNVQHGNKVCPICRAVWKELPFQGPLLVDAAAHGTARVNPSDWPQGRLPRADTVNRRDQFPVFRTPESAFFNDDEQINLQSEPVGGGRDGDEIPASVEIMTYTEFPAIQESVTQENFAILIHLKAPHAPASVSSRAPLDLVTVLDVSGSMAGTKLALLKRAMSFVIESLGHSDRLSVIAFSSCAWRLFPLRKMTTFGRQQSLQAISSLVANGGTNIADGLRKAARVMEYRQTRNPVCSIILLSDGVDTYTVTPAQGAPPDYGLLVPRSILPGGHHVQVHTFGFGADHDSAAMHSVAEMSGGTFSFIDAVGSIQDAFAQCIGGLLSVVAQEARLSIECADEGVLLNCIESGGYASGVVGDGRSGFVDIGDLYADEERDFLVTVRVPAARGDTALILPSCAYRDAVTTETIRVEGDAVILPRPGSPVLAAMSPQVEREWNRVHATEDMAAARAAAEDNDFARAASILESRRRALESTASLSSDPQTQALVAELREMQDRTENRQRYQESGRAYILAGLSSHSWQRATARGDSTELTGLIHTYQTPSMVDMLHRSQALLPEVVEALNRSLTVAPSRSQTAGPASPRRSLARAFRSTKSFTGRSS
ncbi:E3 ubiquitin-protein ligase WAV3-like isoform X2 [Phragmites australis]|uniref:E3 ubiquitin-protein ligase WAV3-like isoform X2 n=1 Tax=Phragmites australis TaxID=29695 RepID=UPI002D79E1ED|nr:E3 ubiquitin-protein ligase WAV3-like isoform X2 [Phragmites australis]